MNRYRYPGFQRPPFKVFDPKTLSPGDIITFYGRQMSLTNRGLENTDHADDNWGWHWVNGTESGWVADRILKGIHNE